MYELLKVKLRGLKNYFFIILLLYYFISLLFYFFDALGSFFTNLNYLVVNNKN